MLFWELLLINLAFIFGFVLLGNLLSSKSKD